MWRNLKPKLTDLENPWNQQSGDHNCLATLLIFALEPAAD